MLKKGPRQYLLQSCFALYCCFLLFVLFLSREVHLDQTVLRHFQKTSNLVPFHTILYQGKGLLRGIRYLLGEQHVVTYHLIYYGKNLLGNLVMLFPFGILMPCIFPKCNHLGRFLLLTVIGIVGVEIAQTLLRVGVTDVDDVILNTAGAVGGFLIFKISSLRQHLPEKRP